MSSIEQFMIPIRFKSERITATAAQSVFNLVSIVLPSTDPQDSIVIINGKRQPQDAYTINTTTQVTMSEALELNDLVEIIIVGRK